MPQRMLHLLHVVTAFMAKWLAGHGHLISFVFRCIACDPPAGCCPCCRHRRRRCRRHPRPLLVAVPFAVACHVQAIRMFQKCFRHGPLFVSVLVVWFLGGLLFGFRFDSRHQVRPGSVGVLGAAGIG